MMDDLLNKAMGGYETLHPNPASEGREELEIGQV